MLYPMRRSELDETDVVRGKNEFAKFFEELFNETSGGDYKVANSARSRDV